MSYKNMIEDVQSISIVFSETMSQKKAGIKNAKPKHMCKWNEMKYTSTVHH